MRAVWIASLMLGLTLAAMARADNPPAKANWISRLFSSDKSARNKVPERAEEESAPVNPAAVRAQAQAAWQRRVDACLKLKAIAIATHDEDLEQKVDKLNQRAWELYLKSSGSVTGPVPVAGSLSDEQIIDKQLRLPPSTSRATGPAASEARVSAREE